MFIWDFVAEHVFNSMLSWLQMMMVGFLNEFFSQMNNMGVEIFEYDWMQAIVLFFNRLGWALFVIGFILAVFECAIAYQKGQGSIQDVGLNLIKGFMAVSLFTVLPIKGYQFAVSLQYLLSKGIAGIPDVNVGSIAGKQLSIIEGMTLNAVFLLFLIIMVGYAVMKVFFANLKRGGILLILICTGSFYMLSIPRGFYDGFIGWCKQIIALCLTAFLQTCMLVAGLMLLGPNLLLGIGVMLAASEVPRIADRYGLDTTTHANVSSAIYAMQSAIGLSHAIAGTKNTVQTKPQPTA